MGAHRHRPVTVGLAVFRQLAAYFYLGQLVVCEHEDIFVEAVFMNEQVEHGRQQGKRPLLSFLRKALGGQAPPITEVWLVTKLGAGKQLPDVFILHIAATLCRIDRVADCLMRRPRGFLTTQ